MSKIGEKIIAALEEGLEALKSDEPLDKRLKVRYHIMPSPQTPCDPPTPPPASDKRREGSE